ncbi:Putative AGC protein kinase [Rhizopus microsporus]|nr:Putative AGC protein kinase [Rhizopus microsporus]
MLYKKKKNNINKLRQHVKPHIGIIETTMMYHSTKDLKDRLVSVFTVFVEEPTRHLVLIRYYEDFQEFYNRIRDYSRKCKIQLPKLHKENRFLYQRHRSDSSTSNSSSSSIGSSTSSNNHNSNHGLRKILQTLSSHRKSNADNLELFLYRCLNDSSIRSCSLLKEFLQPQREDDHVIPKQEVQSYVQLQCINQRELRNNDVDYEEGEEEEEAMTEEEGAAVSTPHLEATRQIDADIVSSIHPHSTISPSDLRPMTESSVASSSSISSRAPVTIQDFQLIKVIGRGCMGKVLLFPAHFDIETATFIARLLKRDPSRRLGSGPDGALRVRLDPYFSCIDWDLIYAKRIKPPYVPNLYSETDFSHFDSEFLQLTPRLSPVSSDYMLSQSLDRAFEGYSYTNREERLLDSPVSELYSLNEPPPPVTLRDRSLLETGATPSYFVYNGSDEVMTYDEYAESSSDDIIHSSDLIRQFPTRSDYTEDDLPPRPVTRLMMSPTNDYCRPESESSSILD